MGNKNAGGDNGGFVINSNSAILFPVISDDKIPVNSGTAIDIISFFQFMLDTEITSHYYM